MDLNDAARGADSAAYMPPSWRNLVLILAVSLFFTTLLNWRTSTLMPGTDIWELPYDHHKYIHMAEAPLGSFHINPACWRLAVPLLVQSLPFEPVVGFRIVTFLAIVFTGFALYVLFRIGLRSNEVTALLSMSLYFAYGSANKLLLGGPYSPDAVSHLLTIVALYFIVRKQDLPLALTLALSATVKETVILVIPLIYTIRASRFVDWKLAIRTAVVALPCFIILAAIRLAIPAWNDNAAYVESIGPQLSQVHVGTATHNYFDALQRISAYRFETQSPINIIRELTWGSGGLFFILPLLAIRENLVNLLRFAPFLGLTYYGWLMALNFNRRLGAAFPLLIFMAVITLRSWSSSWNIRLVAFIPLFIVQYLLNLMQPVTAEVPFDYAAGVFLLSLGVIYSFREKLASSPG